MITRYSQLASDAEFSRSRPSQRIQFEKPLVGPSGASLVAYEWKYVWSLVEDDIEGTIEKRVSDWENAGASDETGRQIVHQFVVQMPDKTYRVVSSETVPVLLGLVSLEQKKTFKNIGNAAKTLVKLQMELLQRQADKERYAKDLEEVKKLPLPEITEEPMEVRDPSFKTQEPVYLVMGDAHVVWKKKEGWAEHEDRIECLTRFWRENRMAEKGWTSQNKPDSYKETDLRVKIKRQEKKLEKITQVSPG